MRAWPEHTKRHPHSLTGVLRYTPYALSAIVGYGSFMRSGAVSCDGHGVFHPGTTMLRIGYGAGRHGQLEYMTFFTGKGDSGTSKLFDSEPGKRVSKSSPVFETLGMLDELNTLIGWCKAGVGEQVVRGQKLRLVLHDVQDHLFTLQAEVAGAPKSIPLSSVEKLGEFIKGIEAELPPVTSFLVPGATELSARLDVARAVSRRAERRLVTLHESGERLVSESSRAYANRLSSLLYALTRFVNHNAGVGEEPPHYQA